MRSKPASWMLGLHAGLLLLASTRFSVVSWIWGNRAWTWNYFQYSHQDGWGYPYRSDYTPAVVAVYIAACLAGVAAYALSWSHVRGVCKVLGMILAVLGLVSFLIEGSHWLWSHHFSWILVCPVAGLLLAGIVIFQLGPGRRDTAGP